VHNVKTAPYTQNVLAGTGGAYTIPPNPLRAAILLSPQTGDTWQVMIGVADASQIGPAITVGAGGLLLTAHQLGTGVSAAITVVSAAGAGTKLSWVEWTYTP
jgi:hypothetical protein